MIVTSALEKNPKINATINWINAGLHERLENNSRLFYFAGFDTSVDDTFTLLDSENTVIVVLYTTSKSVKQI